MSDTARLSVKLFPLKKKGKRDARVGIVPNLRMEGVPQILFRRMSNAVDCAMRADRDRENVPPLVIHVVIPQEEADHFLAYYPRDRFLALKILQLLYTMDEKDRTEFVSALHVYDIFTYEEERLRYKNLLVRLLGTSDTGKWEYTRNIDDFEKFSDSIYIQQCCSS